MCTSIYVSQHVLRFKWSFEFLFLISLGLFCQSSLLFTFYSSMYDFTEDTGNVISSDSETVWEDPVHQLKVDSEREWNRISNEFVNVPAQL